MHCSEANELISRTLYNRSSVHISKSQSSLCFNIHQICLVLLKIPVCPGMRAVDNHFGPAKTITNVKCCISLPPSYSLKILLPKEDLSLCGKSMSAEATCFS